MESRLVPSRLHRESLTGLSRIMPRRRAARQRPRTPDDVLLPRDPHTGGYEPVEQILCDILASAAEVTGADQAFFLVSREGSVLEVACARNIRPAEVMDLVLTRAAATVHRALREGQLSGADGAGRPMPVYDGFFEANAPAVLCVPLDLGLRQSGAMCLIRCKNPRRLSELDLEITQALAEQAALAIGAACHHSALTRLEASLNAPVPARA